MGRFYTGDINGKFGLGVQSSDDGEYFYATELDPYEVPYAIYSEDIPSALEKLEELITEFNESAKPTEKLTSKMCADDCYGLADSDWFHNNTNYLLFSRLCMGFQIAEFARKHPGSNIYFHAEI